MDDVERITLAAKKLKTISQVIEGFFCVFLLFSIAAMAVVSGSMITQLFDNYQIDTATALAKFAFEATIVLFMVWVFKKIFSDMAKGVSPFTLVQAKRLKMAALLQVLHAIFVTVVSPVVSNALLNGAMLGASIAGASATMTDRIIPINMGDIVLAIVLFCAALIVEYGSLLQQLSDDTV